MNIGFYAAIAIGVSAGAFLTLLFVAAWWESKRERFLYGSRGSTIVVLGNSRHDAAAAIRRKGNQ